MSVRAGAMALLCGLMGVGCDQTPDVPPLPGDEAPPSIRGRLGLALVGHDIRPAFTMAHLPRLAGPPAPLDAVWQPATGPAIPLAIIDDASATAALWPLVEPPPGPGRIELHAVDGRRFVIEAFWTTAAIEDHPLHHQGARRRARAAMADSRRGRDDAAIAGMLTASGEWLLAGRPSQAMQCLGAAAHYARRRNDLPRAAEIEEWNAALIDAVDDEEARLAAGYRRALLAKQLGRFRAAEAHLLAAADGMRQLGHDEHARLIERARGNLLGRLGRHAEAVALLDGSPEPEGDPEEAFRARVNRTWARILAMRAGALPADYAAIHRQLAAEVARLPARLPPASKANVYANLTLAALLAGEPTAARRALAEARRSDPRGGGLWPAYLDLLEGELSLADGRSAAAREAFGRAARQARAQVGGGDSIEAWQALYGQGRAALADGDADAALDLWREALAMTRRLAGRTPLSTSHSAFLADRRALVDDLVGMLIARGALDEAFRALDAARAPTLRALAADARLDGLDPAALAEWRQRVSAWGATRQAVDRAEADLETAPLAEQQAARERLEDARRAARQRFDAAFGWLDERAPLDDGDPGEPTTLLPADMALIAFARIADRWHGFLIAGDRLSHRRLSDTDDVIGPWQASLADRRRIYIVDGGLPAARALAERRMTSDGMPWGEYTELVWLPYAGWLRGRDAAAPTGPPLVVADPDGTLPASRRIAVAIAARTGARALVGEAATRAAVLDGLDGAAWFHFDGHGVLGRGEPWQAHLRMARDEILSLADVLATRPRVGTVILSGCETGVPEALSRVESLGLAEGFLLAGASRVVAADRVLGVDEAARFVDAFHRLGGTARPAAALRATIAELRRDGDDAWRGWRVFGVPPSR